MSGRLKRLLLWNSVFLFILLISQYLKKSNYPLIDSFFIIGILNLLVYLWQLVRYLGFFDLSRIAFSNFGSLINSVIKKEEYEGKDYRERRHLKSELNPLFLGLGIISILISILLY